MHPGRNKKKFQTLMQFERVRIIGLQKGGYSYHAIGARVQRNSSTVMRIRKQWTDEYRKTQNIGNGRRKVTSVDDRQLLHMEVNEWAHEQPSNNHSIIVLDAIPDSRYKRWSIMNCLL
ncbi:uncharacterized protein TNCV_679531 [Trichonephila clavipes]|nr:uncharacterized protein TNCV_679531 [Trichonephila clavipes]